MLLRGVDLLSLLDYLGTLESLLLLVVQGLVVVKWCKGLLSRLVGS